ncbi:hypothetical protein BH23BAC4_BH23BAC4_00900 [soil metagenome]
MRPYGYFKTPLLLAVSTMLLASTVQAQYGTGTVLQVPHAVSEIELDGFPADPDWELSPQINLVAHWDSGWEAGFGDPETPDVEGHVRLLWRNGVLYLYIYAENLHPPFFNPDGNPWQANQFLVGVDLTHQGDDQIDSSWGGWPENAPNLGPTTYKISARDDMGITSNWDPINPEWAEGVIVIHEDNNAWSIEMALYGEEIQSEAMIGFNIGGAVAAEDLGREYGWFSWQVAQNPGGDVMNNSASFATLEFVGGGASEGYGTGLTFQVPQATSAITIDGIPDEGAWASATEVDLTENWNSGYYQCPVCGDPEVPDVISTAKLLWDEGVLYVYISSLHPVPLFFNPDGDPWDTNQLLVGVDMTHEGDDQVDNSWGGWPSNAPDLGPTTYKISPTSGITLDWGFHDIFPVDEGWVEGVIVVDEDAQEWSVELAIYGEPITMGSMIGFNVGGAAANEEMADHGIGEYTYAWYSLGAVNPPASAGGDVMRVAASFSTLEFVGSVSGEVVPGTTAGGLQVNFPNPFRDATTVVYALERSGNVDLSVYDVLGRRVAQLETSHRGVGEHEVRFDASGLASGLYIVRLSVDGEMLSTRRMMRIE